MPTKLNSPALSRRNRIRAEIPTLVERLKAAGYYQGVTHKLHVAPVEKFPYDEFISGQNGQAVAEFLARASRTGKPWHLFFNISVSHRPFPNSDQVKIRVKPDEVKLPAFLPNTPVVRKDWAEYLAAIEAADRLVGEGLEALRTSGQETNTMQSLGGQVPALELYDLKSDPDEMRNLVDSPAARPPRDRLYAALCRWVRDTADPAMHPPPHAKE